MPKGVSQYKKKHNMADLGCYPTAHPKPTKCITEIHGRSVRFAATGGSYNYFKHRLSGEDTFLKWSYYGHDGEVQVYFAFDDPQAFDEGRARILKMRQWALEDDIDTDDDTDVSDDSNSWEEHVPRISMELKSEILAHRKKEENGVNLHVHSVENA